MPPPRGTPWISPYTLYFQKLESLAYVLSFLSLIVWVYISSFKFVQWAPKDVSFLQQSAFWPFKVIQGRWFWYQSKARMQLPISPSLWLWSYLAPFLRYGDLLAKNCLFSHPSLIQCPRSLCSLWNFALKLTMRKLRVMGLSSSEDRMIVAGVVLAWYQRVTDGQTDRQTVRRTESIIANTALCIASYADAL